MNMGLIAKQRLQAADKKLNATYRRVLNNLPPDNIDKDSVARRSLIAAQRIWVKWREAECASVGEYYGGLRAWKSTYTVMCMADMTESRVLDLVNQFESNRPTPY